jgi:hypothetical protein
MLTSAREQYREQQLINALGVKEARRVASRGPAAVAAALAAYQAESASLTFASTAAILAEQGITAPPASTALLTPILTGSEAIRLLQKVASAQAFDTLVMALIQDAGRTAATVDLIRRPGVTHYVRSLNLSSCSRCAVLAGRVYRFSTGFQRHPRCDCLMTPTTATSGRDLVLDPTDAIGSGKITGLSRGDVEALDNGADLGRVVNVRSRSAGLRVGSSVYTRGDRLTPQAIAETATSRTQAISMLRANGYIT